MIFIIISINYNLFSYFLNLIKIKYRSTIKEVESIFCGANINNFINYLNKSKSYGDNINF